MLPRREDPPPLQTKRLSSGGAVDGLTATQGLLQTGAHFDENQTRGLLGSPSHYLELLTALNKRNVLAKPKQ